MPPCAAHAPRFAPVTSTITGALLRPSVENLIAMKTSTDEGRRFRQVIRTRTALLPLRAPSFDSLTEAQQQDYALAAAEFAQPYVDRIAELETMLAQSSTHIETMVVVGPGSVGIDLG